MFGSVGFSSYARRRVNRHGENFLLHSLEMCNLLILVSEYCKPLVRG